MSRTAMHQCAPPDCPRMIVTSMLMCPPHWYRVPKAIQTRVWRAWRARQAGKNGSMQQHEDAKADAIKSLEETN